MFKIRVVCLDHYMSKPIHELGAKKDQNSVKEWQEPVLRIFGATEDGFRSCAHIHGVYPYVYVPYKGGENPERDALLLGAALDEALRTSLNQKIFRFVYKVTLVSGIPLYGYHSKRRQFFKIYFYNPFHIKRAYELLLSGAILGQKLQPHEAHIPYALQFMMDYNIYGMSFVTFSRVKYRRNQEEPDSLSGVDNENVLSDEVKKTSWSYLEVDAMASDITNRIGRKAIGINPGLQALWEDEEQRRRAQNRKSQITLERSLSRSDFGEFPTEVMYKTRLAEKLAGVAFEGTKRIIPSEEPTYSYAAEAPESGNFLDASTTEEGSERCGAKENVGDVSVLIDEKILTQISGSQKCETESESDDEKELDSVLGKNQNSEEEAELEDEEGVDLTQPLDSEEEVICGAEGSRDESGSSRGESEKTFWKNMAEKIFQLDGAQESSSESEGDATPTLAPIEVSDGTVVPPSAWPCNIMSILSEESGCPSPSGTCPTPRTLWFDQSPDWLPQESWIWSKTVAPFPDFLGKNQSEGSFSSDLLGNSKEVISGGSHGDVFASHAPEHFPATADDSLGPSAATAYPPSAILTPASEVDASDLNLNSNLEDFWSPSEEKRKLSSQESNISIGGETQGDEKRLTEVLKSFSVRKTPSEKDRSQLTLKQYLKDCTEIVSVDFKNLCNREMIIIEYKSQNKRSLRNKYLIKPLDKFLESWNSAERKASDRSPGKRENEAKELENIKNPTLSSGSVVPPTSSKSKMTSMEISGVGGSGEGRCYSVDENVISQGKIKLKLMKSRMGKLDKDLMKGTLERQSLNLKSVKTEKRKAEENSSKSPGDFGKCSEWKKLTEPDTKLINDINSSFEEYFKTLVERKNFCRKRRKNVVYEEEEQDEKEEEDPSEDEKTQRFLPTEKEKLRVRDVNTSREADSIRFVTRLLSTFSQMSDVPPLSITIRLGSPRASAPVRVNLRPSGVPSVKEATSKKFYGKGQGRKTGIENVDGPADGSSSEESSGSDTEPRPSIQKKRKRESRYKPLDMVLYSSAGEKTGAGRKRKSPEEKEESRAERLKGRRSLRSPHWRGKSKCQPPGEGKEKKSSSRNLVKREKNLPLSHDVGAPEKIGQSGSDRNEEMDYIGDSDEERERKRSKLKVESLKKSKKSVKEPSRKILQAGVKVPSSSEDERKRRHVFEKDSSQRAKEVDQRTVKSFVSEKQEEGRKEYLISEFFEVPSVSESVGGSESIKGSFLPKGAGTMISSQVSSAGALQKKKSPELETFSVNDIVCVASSSRNWVYQPTFSPSTMLESKLHESEKNSPDPESLAAPVSQAFFRFSQESFSSGTSFAAKGFRSQTKFFGCSDSNDSGTGRTTLSWVSGNKVITPRCKPLSCEKVSQSVQHQPAVGIEGGAAFCAGSVYVARTVEMGLSKGADLKPFKGSLGLFPIEERRSASSTGQKVQRWRLVGCEDATITPLTKPPTVSSVVKSWYSKKESGKKSPEKVKMKVMKPLSPGQEMDSEEEMDLSVTVCNLSGESEARAPTQVDLPEAPPRAAENIIDDSEKLDLKKGPLAKIKGIKRFSVLKKSASILEGEQRNSSCSPGAEKGSSKDDNSFQIRGATVDDTFGFPHSVENLEEAKLGCAYQYVGLLVMELHVQTRKNFRPDPDLDPIRALFYAVTFDSPTRNREEGILVVGDRFLSGSATSQRCVHYVASEKLLVEKFVTLVRGWDPDILTGYEIEMNSWGYLVQRAFVFEMNLIVLLGRVHAEESAKKNFGDFSDPGGETEDVPKIVKRMRISGRIVLDAWRVLRHEIALRSYTFENVMYHLLHERHPVLSYQTLSHFWEHPSRRFRHIVVEHFGTRVLGLIRILDQLDFVNRTSELARLFGIQFYEVLSRGSQFRVESMMLRLAKPLNYVPASPSVAQRAAMRAPASLPLILEPESLFYTDPIIVLDFQSLYPSIIIAYNYCFSTCLGRVEKLGGRDPFEFGCTQLQVSPEELKRLEKDVTVSPAGVVFVKPNIRKGVLPTLLEKILETRLMIKKSMKEHKENKVLQKVLFSRQLGLKLIANVTYGYTAANFSGRMPCIEVGDSVVSKGRETLHRAIQLVKNNREWGARVVYGDTDSIFVLIPGRSREEAFRIGAEIAEVVTRDNPKPVKLKLEKVYQPCILQTKKRYLGYAFESPDQEQPAFEAKGVEIVRRDGCPAAGKILEKALRILFDTRDVSLVKKYTLRQFAKLYQGRVNLQDLIFAKEYRGRNGYRANACVPALQLAKQWTQQDKRAEPRVKERVPYVIVNGPPGVPLIRLVRSPQDLICDPSLRANAVYYITKAVIPAMQRCFSLLGVDVPSWYGEMPRKYRKMYRWNCNEGQKRSTISQYFTALECVVCSEVTCAPVCQKCERDPQALVVTLGERIRLWERCHEGLVEMCRSCCGRPGQPDCVSLDCPVLFRREQARRSAEQGQTLRGILSRYL